MHMTSSNTIRSQYPLEKEVWRSIPGWKRYEVSSFGRTRKLNTSRDPYYQKPMVEKTHPYFTVDLSEGKRKKRYTIHKLVAIAFIDRPKQKKNISVDHIDNNPHNNHLRNLRWITQSENIQRAYDQGRKQRNQGSTNGQSKLSEEKVLKIRSLLKTSALRTDIAKQFDISISHLREIGIRKRWSHI